MPEQTVMWSFVYLRFDEFDEAIDEAIEDDIKEADGGGKCFITFCCVTLPTIYFKFSNYLLWFQREY